MRVPAKMFLKSTAVVIFIIILSAGCFAQSKENSALVGTWDVVVDIEGEENYSNFEFSVENDSLSGTWSGDYGESVCENIQLSENMITFNFSIDMEGQAMYIEVSCELKDDSMYGTVSTDMGEFQFTANKRE